MTESTNNKNKSKHKTLDFHPLITIGILAILSIGSTLLTYNYNSWPLWGLVVSSALLGMLTYFILKLLSKIAILLAFSANLKEFLFKLKQQIFRVSLFSAITIWTIAAATAYTALNWRWGQNGPLSGWTLNGEQSGPLERIKSSLVIIGGIGGVGYLVIKYRQQSGAERDRARLEENEADKKLADAVQQLGSESPQVRIAGVYALADVADTYAGPYPQRVVDILCGYLRTQRTHSNYDRIKRPTNADATKADDNKRNTQHFTNIDNVVESTIVSTLASHLKVINKTSDRETYQPGAWSHCSIDLHGSTLTESIDFSNTYIAKINTQNANIKYIILDHATVREAIFEDVNFMQEAKFKGTTFKETASFSRSTFIEDAHFQSVKFTKITDFNNTTFEQHANFAGTSDDKSTFGTRVDFQGVRFLNGANFCFSVFQSNDFLNATFDGYINFKNVDFFRRAEFIQIRKSDNPEKKLEIEFSGHLTKGGLFSTRDCIATLILSSAEFTDGTSFKGPFEIQSKSKTIFNNGAMFRNCRIIAFNNTRLKGDCRFEGIFGEIECADVDFVGCADFKGVSGNFDPVEQLKFNDVRFNSGNKEGVRFREYWTLVDGLPEGAQWVKYDRDGNPSSSHLPKQLTNVQGGTSSPIQENTFAQLNPDNDTDGWTIPR